MFRRQIGVSAIGVGCFALIGSLTTSSSAASPLSFTNEALARGVNFRAGFNHAQVGAGTMLADLDGDGDLDILLAGGQFGNFGLFENDGTGRFTDRSLTSGFTPMVASGLSAGDYDNDGDLDIHVPGWFAPSRLYRNNGDMTFTEVGAQAGVDLNAPSMAASWGDYNRDGWLDLYATVRTFTDNVEIENRLYRNNGDGTFTDVAADLGVQAPGDPSCLPAFFDYDRDGDDDIYIGTDKGSMTSPLMLHNKLYRNNGDGTFYNATYEAGVEAWIFCMGIAVGDLNFDGYFDMYLTNIMQGNILYMHNGDDTYSDQTAAAGMQSNRVGWGTVFADFDNDTHLDTYVCNIQGANRLYRGSPAWPLIDEAPQAGVDVIWDVYCMSVGDIDNDGDLDMLVGNTNRRVNLFINHSQDTASNRWVRLNIAGLETNKFSVGTCVEVTAKGVTQTREVRSGVNYKSHDEYTLHYGLGDAAKISLIEVFFAHGERRALYGAPTNHTWIIHPATRLGDPNGDGVIDEDEIRQAMALRTGPGGQIAPGQEIFDMDGDFDIDAYDIAMMGLGILEPTPM